MGGFPYSITHRLPSPLSNITLPDISIEQLLEEDKNAPLASPLRYG